MVSGLTSTMTWETSASFAAWKGQTCKSALKDSLPIREFEFIIPISKLLESQTSPQNFEIIGGGFIF